MVAMDGACTTVVSLVLFEAWLINNECHASTQLAAIVRAASLCDLNWKQGHCWMHVLLKHGHLGNQLLFRCIFVILFAE